MHSARAQIRPFRLLLPTALLALDLCHSVAAQQTPARPLDPPSAAKDGNGESAVLINVHRFKMVDGPDRFASLETILPQVLKARLLRYHWLTLTDAESNPGDAGLRKQPANTSEAGLELTGTYVVLDDSIRVDVSLARGRDNSVAFQGFETLHEETIFEDVDRMGQRVIEALAGGEAPTRPDRRVVVVAIADFVNGSNPSSPSSMGPLVSASLLTQLSGAGLKNVAFTRLNENRRPGAAGGKAEFTVRGEYTLEANRLKLQAHLEEAQTAATRADLNHGTGNQADVYQAEADGSFDQFSGVTQQLSESVLEIVQGRVMTDARLRPLPFSLRDATPEQCTEQATRYVHSQDYFPAILLYRKSLEKNAQFTAAHIGLADVYLLQGNFSAAIGEYRKILESSPQDLDVLLGIASAYLKLGNATDALTYVIKAEHVEQTNPAGFAEQHGSLTVAQLKGDAYVLLLRPKDAVAEYKRAMTMPGGADSRELFHSLERAYRILGDTGNAIQLLKGALARFPEDKELASDLASSYVAEGESDFSKAQYDRSFTEFQAALQLKPENKIIQAEALGYAGAITSAFASHPDLERGIAMVRQSIELDGNSEWNRRFLGVLLNNAGRYRDAIESLKQAIAIEPRVNSYRELSSSFRMLGDYEEAQDYVQKALSMDPQYGLGYGELGDIYLAKKDYPHAIENLKRATELENSADAWVDLTNGYLKSGNTQDALDAAQHALKLGKRSSAAYLSLQEVYAARKERDKFLGVMESAVSADPDYGWGLTKLGDLYREAKRYNDAARYLKKAITLNGNDRWPREVLAQTYLENKDDENARLTLEQSLVIDPTVWGYAQLGLIYHRRKDSAKALEYLNKALILNPVEPQVYKSFETLYDDNKQPDEFLALLERTKQDHPDFAWAFRKAGELYSSREDNTKAIENLEQAHALAPSDGVATQDLASAHLTRARKEQAAGAYDEAITHYQKAIDLSPSDNAFESFADLYRARKDWVNEIAVSQKFLDAKPQSEKAFFDLVQAYMHNKDYARALDVVHQGLEAIPSSAELYSERGAIHQIQKDYAAAIADGREAIRIAPRYSYPYQLLASVENDQRLYQRAQGNARKAIELEDLDAYDELRQALMGMNRYREAADELEAALKKHPKELQILAGLGIVYHEGFYDDPRGYIRAYETNKQALELDATNLVIRANLAEASLTAEHYEEAVSLANSVLSDPTLPPEDKLSMKMIMIAALLCQRKDAYAFSELSEFIRYHESIKEDYERTWVFAGTRNFIQKHKTLTESERSLILKLIDILESPRQKANVDLRNLKDTLPQLFRQFQKES